MIQVDGNRRIEDATVRTYLRLAPGDRYSAARASDSLKNLFETGLFKDVNINMRGSTLLVVVVENPIINRVAFEGNQKFKDDVLTGQVQVRPRTVFTQARVQADVQRLVVLYRRTGWFAARIVPKIIKLDRDRVDLVFEIDEGEATEISRINFIGNRAFSDSDLRDEITTAESNWWDAITDKGRSYDPDKLNFDRELLRRFYLKNGYADFRVISAVAEIDREQQNFFITFTVVEGVYYSFGLVEIDSSLSVLPLDLVEQQILMAPGETYDASKVEKSVENISLEASKVGFAFIQVRPRPQRNPDNLTIDLIFEIDDGPRVYIERINIYGNVRTQDEVIRREFRLAEGDAFNRSLVRGARRNLQALGFFKTINIRTERGSQPDRIILNVEVEEKSTGDLNFSVGYSTTDSVVGAIALTERNLMGRGQYLRIKTQLSTSNQQIDLRFTEPYFLGRKLAAGFDIFGSETDSSDESSFKSRKIGGGLRLGFALNEYLYLNTRYAFTQEELFDVDSDASLAVKAAVGTSIVSAVGYTLTYNTLNSPIKPTEGVKVSISNDLAGVGGDVNYLRTQVRGAAFYEFMPKVVGSIRGSAGNIIGWNGKDVRLLDGFFKGGELVRGFDRSGIGPRDASTGDALGGKLFYGASAEVQFPIGLPEEFGITGAAFIDAGSLSDVPAAGGATVDDDSALRASGGVSILWDSPLGPLRVDLAEAFLKQDYDKTRIFNFTGGFQF
ncbi:MAG: outer membrane protein assembly factor BamA [Alphaproteobacteria bacterium]